MKKILLFLLLGMFMFSFTSASYCYQESFNVTNQTGIDGSCSLNYSGSYGTSGILTNLINVFDGNWNTYGNPGDIYYVNYSKPETSFSTIWQVKYSYDRYSDTKYTTNVSIIDTCFNFGNNIQLRAYHEPSIIKLECYNGTWNTLYENLSMNAMNIGEEAMYWNVDSTAPIISLLYPTGTIPYGYVNQTLQLNFSATDENLDKCGFGYYKSFGSGSGLGGNRSNDYITTYYNNTNYSMIARLYMDRIGTPLYKYTVNIPTTCNNGGKVTLWDDDVNVSCINTGGANVTLAPSVGGYGVLVQFFEITDCSSGVFITPNIILGGTKSIRVYASDDAGNLNISSFSWDYNIFENTTIYTNPILEGSVNTINSSIITNYTPTSIFLNYSGTLYSPSITSISSGYQLSTTLLAPSVTTDTNKTFYYIYVVGGNTFTSQTYTQQVSNVNLTTTCSGSSFMLLNITNYDEESLLKMNGTVEYVVSIENNGVGLYTINGNQTGINLGICSNINLSSTTATYSLELRYYTSGYFYETYNIENSPTSSMPITLPLYFLNQSNGIQFKINYVDFNYFQHPGAIIQIQRQYLTENVYKIIELPKIGDNGQSVGSFSTNNIRYKLIVVENEEVLDTFDNVFPACQNVILGTCELNLRGIETSPTTTIGDFTYTLTQTNTSLIFTYIIPSGIPQSVTLITSQSSRFLSNLSNCNTTVYGSGGTITCGYNNTVGDSLISTTILVGSETLYGQVHVSEDLSGYYMLNNYVIGFVLLLSLALMFVSSGVLTVIVSVVGFMFLGVIFLLKGFSLTTITSSLMWLVIACVIVVYKISQKEEKT